MTEPTLETETTLLLSLHHKTNILFCNGCTAELLINIIFPSKFGGDNTL